MKAMSGYFAGFHDLWQARNSRERLVLGAGALIVVAMLLYQFVWVPVDHWSQDQQARLQHTADVAAFAAKARHILASKPAAAQHHPAGRSLMQLAYRAAQKQHIVDHITRREPVGSQGVRVAFSGVSFAALSRWIAAMNGYGLQVKQASVSPPAGAAKPNGLVDAHIRMVRDGA